MERKLVRKDRRRRKQHRFKKGRDPSPLDQILSDPIAFVGELRNLVNQANRERGMILVRAFEEEYPDHYAFALSLVDQTPKIARNEVIKIWPKAGLMKLYPDHLRWIEFIQNQIKLRREEKHERNSRRGKTRRVAGSVGGVRSGAGERRDD